MKTQFKVFKSTWGYHTMEELVKEYQEEHHLEIKDIMLIRNNEDKPVVGVLFEESSEYKEQLRNSKFRCNAWSYGEVEPGAH